MGDRVCQSSGKTCSKCLSRGPFGKLSRSSDGLHYHCKKCVSATNKLRKQSQSYKDWNKKRLEDPVFREIRNSKHKEYLKKPEVKARVSIQHKNNLKRQLKKAEWNRSNVVRASASRRAQRNLNPDLYNKKMTEWRKKVREADPRSARATTLRRVYKITLEQYDSILEAQGNVCGLCGGPFSDSPSLKECVDHCHQTGRIRAVIHDRCNRGIGAFSDSLELVELAVVYLKKHQ